MTEIDMARQYAIEGWEKSLDPRMVATPVINKNKYEAYLAGFHEGQPKWHDLRKDLNDLPKDEGKFITSSYLNLIIRMKGTTYNSLAQGKYNFDTKEFEYAHLEGLTEVIAWTEIPQFKE